VQITAAENTGKKNETLAAELSSLKHQLEAKNKEIHRLRQELDALIKSQLSDYAVFESIILSLEKKVVDLGKRNILLVANLGKDVKYITLIVESDFRYYHICIYAN
jgi:predicted RNase H-like nuclease (RuvC/YqgF family)